MQIICFSFFSFFFFDLNKLSHGWDNDLIKSIFSLITPLSPPLPVIWLIWLFFNKLHRGHLPPFCF